MIDFHRYVAYAIPAGFGLLFLWALVSFIRNRPPHDLFWRLLAVLQVVVGVQVLVGVIMFLTGLRPPSWRHYFYGGFFPVIVLFYAHRFARSERWESIPWIPFGMAALLNVGLTVQALRTGFAGA